MMNDIHQVFLHKHGRFSKGGFKLERFESSTNLSEINPIVVLNTDSVVFYFLALIIHGLDSITFTIAARPFRLNSKCPFLASASDYKV